MEYGKILILYRSKYGATERYANILKSKLDCDVFNLSNSQPLTFKEYNTIILVGAIYASGIAGIDFIRKNYDEIKDKKLAVLSIGASPYDKKALEEIKIKNLKEDLKHIPVFYARGAWDEDRMNFKDKILCKMLSRFIEKRDPSTYEPWMKAFAESKGKKCDWVDEKYLIPLMEYVQ